MKDSAEQTSIFKQWYDAQWLGDGDHGQSIPLNAGDPKYTEYLDGYTLALGAWIVATEQEREACAKLCEAVRETHEDNPEYGSWGEHEDCAEAIRAR